MFLTETTEHEGALDKGVCLFYFLLPSKLVAQNDDESWEVDAEHAKNTSS